MTAPQFPRAISAAISEIPYFVPRNAMTPAVMAYGAIRAIRRRQVGVMGVMLARGEAGGSTIQPNGVFAESRVIQSFWASSWSFRAFQERSYCSISQAEVGMALLS
jgi:hypothetical protein